MTELQDLLEAKIPHRDVVVKPCACWPDDVTPLMIEAKPRVVLFSGHGGVGAQSSLAFQTREGELQLVAPDDVVECLSFNERLEAVVLNACRTHKLALAIRDALLRKPAHGDGPTPAAAGVVCWKCIVETEAAAAFSRGFFNEVARQAQCRVDGEIACDEPPTLPLALSRPKPSFFDHVGGGEGGGGGGRGEADAATAIGTSRGGGGCSGSPVGSDLLQHDAVARHQSRRLMRPPVALGGIYEAFCKGCEEFTRSGFRAGDPEEWLAQRRLHRGTRGGSEVCVGAPDVHGLPCLVTATCNWFLDPVTNVVVQSVELGGGGRSGRGGSGSVGLGLSIF